MLNEARRLPSTWSKLSLSPPQYLIPPSRNTTSITPQRPSERSLSTRSFIGHDGLEVLDYPASLAPSDNRQLSNGMLIRRNLDVNLRLSG